MFLDEAEYGLQVVDRVGLRITAKVGGIGLSHSCQRIRVKVCFQGCPSFANWVLDQKVKVGLGLGNGSGCGYSWSSLGVS